MDFHLPELGEGVYEAELVAWHVKPGEPVKRGQVLLEVLTDKATMEVPSPFAGTITELRSEPGQQLKVGQHVLTYTPAGPQAKEASVAREAPADAGRPPQAQAPVPDARPNGQRGTAQRSVVRASPSVRLMARKLGIELAGVQGSGPEGRILVEDVASRMKPKEGRAPEPRPDYGTPGTRIKFQGLRRKIAEHLSHSKQVIPHYSYVDECDVTDLVRLREMVRETYAAAGVRLTYLAFFIKAVVGALKEVPLVNASLDDQAGEIVLHDRYHIGIATATQAGLVVPVVRDADRKDLTQIAREIEKLSADARSGKARREDLRGSTFTITSIGGIGGLISAPVINHPEVAILGIGKVVKRPVYDATGSLKPADVIYLSLSFDHRVVDGAVGAVFGNAIVRRLQNPAAMLLPARLG
jgi:pyruvate dehydrogenase E2 component (dihydrolipoamide acetyltransferase)/2-oxoisovalerate dehydrogenase E2 component (dihydrolipoyl transacylase)